MMTFRMCKVKDLVFLLRIHLRRLGLLEET